MNQVNKSDAWEWFRWGIQAQHTPYNKDQALIEFDKAWISVNGLACMFTGCKNPANKVIVCSDTQREINICDECYKMIQGAD